MIQRVYRRLPAVVLSAPGALRRWSRRPLVRAVLVLCVLAGWAGSALAPAWRFAVNGEHRGVLVTADEHSLVLLYRRGWPSKRWMDREHLRSGRNWFGDNWFYGFGVVRSGGAWSGENRIVVLAYGIGLPWYYLLLLTATGPATRAARGWWLRRRAARRRRRGLCPQCGYDVRASTGRCPECGGPIAGQYQNITTP